MLTYAWCLRFLEVAFNIEGQMVRGNQSYVLQRLIMNGPANIVCSPEERTRYKINLELAQRAGTETLKTELETLTYADVC